MNNILHATSGAECIRLARAALHREARRPRRIEVLHALLHRPRPYVPLHHCNLLRVAILRESEARRLGGAPSRRVVARTLLVHRVRAAVGARGVHGACRSAQRAASAPLPLPAAPPFAQCL